MGGDKGEEKKEGKKEGRQEVSSEGKEEGRKEGKMRTFSGRKLGGAGSGILNKKKCWQDVETG